MRFIILAQYFNRPNEPGGSRHLHVAEHFAGAGHDVTVITSSINYRSGRVLEECRGRLWHRERAHTFEIVRLWSFSKFRGSMRRRMLFFLSFALSASVAGTFMRRPDVLFVSSTPLTIGLPGLWLSWLWRRPLVFEVRDLWPDAAVVAGALKEGRQLRLAYRLEKALYAKAVAIVCLTRGILEGVAGKGVDRKKLFFIPNGVDDWIADEHRPREAAGPFHCVYVGALGVWNHCGPLVEAAALMKGEAVTFEFIGEGEDRPRLEAIAGPSTGEHIRFTGALPKRQAVDRIRAASVCLVAASSHPFHEGILPNKLFDYMGCGRPVVVAARGEMSDFVLRAGAGLVVPPDDPGAIVEALRRLRSLPAADLEAMGERGRQAVNQGYLRRQLNARLIKLLEAAGAHAGIQSFAHDEPAVSAVEVES